MWPAEGFGKINEEDRFIFIYSGGKAFSPGEGGGGVPWTGA